MFIRDINGLEAKPRILLMIKLKTALAVRAQKAASEADFSFLAPMFWLITMEAPVLITV